MFDLTGKRALVTGATGGIGASIATALHAQGAELALSGSRGDSSPAPRTGRFPTESRSWRPRLRLKGSSREGPW